MKLRTILMLILSVSFVAVAMAGPKDISSKYAAAITIPLPPGLEGPTQEVIAIVDSGGSTVISHADAKKLGLLDADGNPIDPPAGTIKIGGVGSGSIKCHVFDDVTITVTPIDENGNPGTPKDIKVSVVVPAKPEDQTQIPNPNDREKMVSGVPTLLGPNVVGGKFPDGTKLGLIDKKGPHPRRNRRGTGWYSSASNPNPHYSTPAEFLGAGSGSPKFSIPEIGINGQPFSAGASLAPMTMLPEALAQGVGFKPYGKELLDRELQDVLFTRGYLNEPSLLNAFEVQLGTVDIEVIGDNGAYLIKEVMAMIHPDPNFNDIVIGVNGLIDEDHNGNLTLDVGGKLGVLNIFKN